MQLEHNPMQLWPKPKNLAVKERSSIKNMTLRSRLQAYGVKSGVKGRDERHRTAPLTPLPTPTPLHALDTANVVRDVKSSKVKRRLTENVYPPSLQFTLRHIQSEADRPEAHGFCR